MLAFRKATGMTIQHSAYIPLAAIGISQYQAAGDSEEFSLYSGQPFVKSKLDWTFTFFFILFYFIFKLYKIVLVLPNIKMNPPQVYM